MGQVVVSGYRTMVKQPPCLPLKVFSSSLLSISALTGSFMEGRGLEGGGWVAPEMGPLQSFPKRGAPPQPPHPTSQSLPARSCVYFLFLRSTFSPRLRLHGCVVKLCQLPVPVNTLQTGVQVLLVLYWIATNQAYHMRAHAAISIYMRVQDAS